MEIIFFLLFHCHWLRKYHSETKMERFSHFIWCSIVVFLISVCTADECVPKGPCSCEFSNGTGIDLAPAVKATFYQTQIYQLKNNGSQYELSTYYYHPCFDVLLKINATASVNTCTKPLSVRYILRICPHYTMKCNI